MVKLTPKSDEQFEKEEVERRAKWQPWPPNVPYDYEIVSAKNTLTKAKPDKPQREMIEIEVKIYNDKGESKQITDYLGEWNDWKIKRICEANGLLDRYESGQVDDQDLWGKTGKCELGVQKGTQKDDGTFYPDKNVIKEFLKIAGTKPKAAPINDDEFGDSIPF